MKNYNYYKQNQNTIQAPPSINERNNLNNIGTNANINQISNNLKNIKIMKNNMIPNVNMNEPDVNNVTRNANTEFLNLSEQFNVNGN